MWAVLSELEVLKESRS
jgi:hypothetical protein